MHRADGFVLHVRHFGLKVGDAEVRDLDDAVIDDKNVLRLDITVDNAFPVRVGKRRAICSEKSTACTASSGP